MKITGGFLATAGWALADLINAFRDEEQQAQYARNKAVAGKIASTGMAIGGKLNPEGKADTKKKAGPPTEEKIPVTPEQPKGVQEGLKAHNAWLEQQKPGYKGPGGITQGPGGKITTTPQKALPIQATAAAGSQKNLNGQTPSSWRQESTVDWDPGRLQINQNKGEPSEIASRRRKPMYL